MLLDREADNLLKRRVFDWLSREQRALLEALRKTNSQSLGVAELVLPNMPLVQLKEGESMLYPYPTDPLGAIDAVICYLKGECECTAELAHAVWHVGGFVLAQFDTCHPTPVLASCLSEDECKKVALSSLEKVKECFKTLDCDGSKGLALDDSLAIPWALIFQVLLAILDRFLKPKPA